MNTTSSGAPQRGNNMSSACAAFLEDFDSFQRKAITAAQFEVLAISLIERLERRPAADTGQAVAWPSEVTEEMELAGREYARNNDPSTFAGIFEAMLAAAEPHPAPLDAERVREDERDRLFEEATYPKYKASVLRFLHWRGAMLPADRAALRQNEGE